MTGWRLHSARLLAGLVGTSLIAGCAADKLADRSSKQSAPIARSSADRQIAAALPGERRTLSTPPAKSNQGSVHLASHEASPLPGTPPDAVAAHDASAAVAAPAGSTAAAAAPAVATHPIDLETVLQLTSGQNPQVAFARERIQEAFAQLDRAQVLWLPSLRAGVTYNKHEGAIQDVAGNVFNTSRGALYSGFGAAVPGAASPGVPGLYANFSITDTVFQPKIAAQTAASRQAAATAANNDALLDAALAYLELLRAEQDVAIARDARDHTRQLANLTGAYAQAGKGTEADHDRAQAELALRENDLVRSHEAVAVASARLSQILSLDPLFAYEVREPTVVPIELVSKELPPAELVARGLSHRPEVAECRHLVCEAVERLRREKMAPLIPSVILGVSYGGYGGGLGSDLTHFNNRFDADAVAYWELRNLGLGERAIRGEAQSRVQQAQLKEVAALDRVAREVVEAHTQVEARRQQIATAQEGVQRATASYEKNLERIRNVQGLPIEVLQAIQALAQARRDYLRTLVSYNEAQFRLHRALGWPAGLQ
ncbi:MAG: TolC family protein [Planctomycetia bacterium]|nr:TolC family protein [Planctomycetia bacterium]